MPRTKQQLAEGRGSPVVAILIFVVIAAAVMVILTLRQLAGAEQHCLRLLAGFAERVEFRVEDLADRFAQIAAGADSEAEAADQTERIQHLSWAGCSGDFGEGESAPRKLAPELGVRTSEGELYLSLRTGNFGKCEVAHGVISLDRLASPAVVSGFYDAVLIADDAGEVLFQVGDPELRFSGMRALFGGEAPRDQTQMKAVEIAKRKYRVFLQPISLEISLAAQDASLGTDVPPVSYDLTAYGIVGHDKMLSSSFMSSPTLLVFLLAIFPSCLLFWPLLKLWLISSRQRYTRFDLACLLACCVVGLAILTVGAFTLQFHLSSMRVAKDQVRGLAAAVEQSLEQELVDISDMLGAFADHYLSTLKTAPDGCLRAPSGKCLIEEFDGWLESNARGLEGRKDLLPYPYFFSMYGLTAAGTLSHVVALSPYSGATSKISDRAYYDCARRDQGIKVGESTRALCVQSILSNTSGRALAAIAVSRQALGLGKDQNPDLIGAALTTEFRSITRPPLPDGIQLALVDSQGAVQFHSDPTRNLSEDLLRATDGDSELRSVLRQRRTAQLSLNYLGLDQLAYVQPVEGLPWSLVVLRPRADIRQRTLELLLDHLNILVLHLLALCLTLGVLFGLQYVAGMQRPSTWVRHLWPQSGQLGLYDTIVLVTPLALLAFLYAFEIRGIESRFWLAFLWPPLVSLAIFYLWWNRSRSRAGMLIVWVVVVASLVPWWNFVPGDWPLGVLIPAVAFVLYLAHLGLRGLESELDLSSSVLSSLERLNLFLATAVLGLALLSRRLEGLRLPTSISPVWLGLGLTAVWLLALGILARWENSVETADSADPTEEGEDKDPDPDPDPDEERDEDRDPKPVTAFGRVWEWLARRTNRFLEWLGGWANQRLEEPIWPNLLGTVVTVGAFYVCLRWDEDALTVVFVTTLVCVTMARIRFQRYFQGGERRIAYVFALACTLFLLGVVPVTGFLRLAGERQRQEQVQATQLALASALETYSRRNPSMDEALRDPLWRSELDEERRGRYDWTSAASFATRLGCNGFRIEGPSPVDRPESLADLYWKPLFGTRTDDGTVQQASQASGEPSSDSGEPASSEPGPGSDRSMNRFWPEPGRGRDGALGDPGEMNAGARRGVPLPLGIHQIVDLLARRLGTVEDPASTGIGTDLSRFGRPGTEWFQTDERDIAGRLKIADESCEILLVSRLPTDYGAKPGTIFQSLWVILGLLLLPSTAFGLSLVLAERVVFVSLAEPRRELEGGRGGGYRKLVEWSCLHTHPFLVVTTTPELTFDSLTAARTELQREASLDVSNTRIEKGWEAEAPGEDDLLDRLSKSWEKSKKEGGRLIVVASDDPRIVAARGEPPRQQAAETEGDDAKKETKAEPPKQVESGRWTRFFSRFEVHHTGRSHESGAEYAQEIFESLGEQFEANKEPPLSDASERRKLLDKLVVEARERAKEKEKGKVSGGQPQLETYQRDFADAFETIFEECRATRWLQEVGRGMFLEMTAPRPDAADEPDDDGSSRGAETHRAEARQLRWAAVEENAKTPRRHLVSRIGRNARAYYSAIWNGCTTDEQVVLYQLSRHGMANPYNFDVVSGLLQKGILVQDPAVRMMNESFATFVRGTVHRAEVAEWEEEEGTSAWTVLKWILPLPLLLIGGFLFVTQGTAWGNFVGLLVALGSVVPILSNTYNYFKTITARRDVST